MAELTALIWLESGGKQKHENSNFGIYDLYLIAFQFVMPCYIFLNKIKPTILREIYETIKTLKNMFLSCCSWKGIFERLVAR